MKYRIKQIDNYYYPQKRVFFIWFNYCDSSSPHLDISFRSKLEAAEKNYFSAKEEYERYKK